MKKRVRHCPLVFLLIQIGREYYLLDVDTAVCLGEDYATMNWVRGVCLGRWNGSIDFEELSSLLQSG